MQRKLDIKSKRKRILSGILALGFTLSLSLSLTVSSVSTVKAESLTTTATLLGSYKNKLTYYEEQYKKYSTATEYPNLSLRIGYYLLYRETAIFMYTNGASLGSGDMTSDSTRALVLYSNNMADALALTNGTPNDTFIKYLTKSDLSSGYSFPFNTIGTTGDPRKYLTGDVTGATNITGIVNNYLYPANIYVADDTNIETSGQVMTAFDSLLTSAFSKIDSSRTSTSSTYTSNYIQSEYYNIVTLYNDSISLEASLQGTLNDIKSARKIFQYSLLNSDKVSKIQPYLDTYAQASAINTSLDDVSGYLESHSTKGKTDLSKLIDFGDTNSLGNSSINGQYCYLLSATSIYKPLISRVGDSAYMKVIGSKSSEMLSLYKQFGYTRKPLLETDISSIQNKVSNGTTSKTTGDFVTLKELKNYVLNNDKHAFVVARGRYDSTGKISGNLDTTTDGTATVDSTKTTSTGIASASALGKESLILGDSYLSPLSSALDSSKSLFKTLTDDQIKVTDSQYTDITSYVKTVPTNNIVMWLNTKGTSMSMASLATNYLNFIDATLIASSGKVSSTLTTNIIVVNPIGTTFSDFKTAMQKEEATLNKEKTASDGHVNYNRNIHYLDAEDVLTKSSITDKTATITSVQAQAMLQVFDSQYASNSQSVSGGTSKSTTATDATKDTKAQNALIQAALTESNYSNPIFSTGFYDQSSVSTGGLAYIYKSLNLLNLDLYNAFIGNNISSADLDSPLYMDFLGNIVTSSNLLVCPGIANYAIYGEYDVNSTTGKAVSSSVNHLMLNRAFLSNYPHLSDGRDMSSSLVPGDENKYALRVSADSTGTEYTYLATKLTGLSLTDYESYANSYKQSTIENIKKLTKANQTAVKAGETTKTTAYTPASPLNKYGQFDGFKSFATMIRNGTSEYLTPVSDIITDVGTISTKVKNVSTAVDDQASIKIVNKYYVGSVNIVGAPQSVSALNSTDTRQLFVWNERGDSFLSNNTVSINGKQFSFNNLSDSKVDEFLTESNYWYLTSSTSGVSQNKLLNCISVSTVGRDVIFPAYYGFTDTDTYYKNLIKNYKYNANSLSDFESIVANLDQSVLNFTKNQTGILGFSDSFDNKIFSFMITYGTSYGLLIILGVFLLFLFKYARSEYSFFTSMFMGGVTSAVLYLGLTVFPTYVPVALNLYNNYVANVLGLNAMMFDLEKDNYNKDVYQGFDSERKSVTSKYALDLYKFGGDGYNYFIDLYNSSGLDLSKPIILSGVETYVKADTIRINSKDMWKSSHISFSTNSDGTPVISIVKDYDPNYSYYCPYDFIQNGLVKTLNKYVTVAKPATKTVLYGAQTKENYVCNSLVSSGVFVGYPQLDSTFQTNMEGAFNNYCSTYPMDDFLGILNNYTTLVLSKSTIVNNTQTNELGSLWFKNMDKLYNSDRSLCIAKIMAVNEETKKFMFENSSNLRNVSDETYIRIVSTFAMLTFNQKFTTMNDMLYPQTINYADMSMFDLYNVVLPSQGGIFIRNNADLVDYCINQGGVLGVCLLFGATVATYLNVKVMTNFYSMLAICLLFVIIRKLVSRDSPTNAAKSFIKISVLLVAMYYSNTFMYYKLYQSSFTLNGKLFSIMLYNAIFLIILIFVAKVIFSRFFDLGYGGFDGSLKNIMSKSNVRGRVKLDQDPEYAKRRDRFNNSRIDKEGIN